MNHEDLDAWKFAIDLAASVYKVTRSFPDDEKYGLVSQMRRAVVSIPSNIAEGAARSGSKEFLQFLAIAAGSASELSTQLIIAGRIGLGNQDELAGLRQELTRISMLLQGLMRSIKAKETK
ncbi:four helix bundle protein [Geobacter argillaceus]|uniref:four helix bundle protein n=1 Tax=Geobacter argillaceus TaxID=345631 RepID=UPI001FE4D3CE|nr:four helix bundle protein [Geobacter argillaceus]